MSKVAVNNGLTLFHKALTIKDADSDHESSVKWDLTAMNLTFLYVFFA